MITILPLFALAAFAQQTATATAADLTQEQAQFSDLFKAVIFALPECTFNCLKSYAPTANTPYDVASLLCADQSKFVAAENACLAANCTAPADIATSQTFIASVPAYCAQAQAVFPVLTSTATTVTAATIAPTAAATNSLIETTTVNVATLASVAVTTFADSTSTVLPSATNVNATLVTASFNSTSSSTTTTVILTTAAPTKPPGAAALTTTAVIQTTVSTSSKHFVGGWVAFGFVVSFIL
ncbi:hypothetical protein HDU79_009665 [Rhizoclosmatium sp. JEL0117]|nr:hypothetical protein HDU79_009665 [Rhizoclosmatium sp. JEL0117]